MASCARLPRHFFVEALQAKLEAGCKQLNLNPPIDAVENLLRYLALVEKWNKTYNLTAITEPTKMVIHHLLDSLVVDPWLSEQSANVTTAYRLIDVGTGAGLPGIPLAILHPNWRVHLLDSNGKKTRFLTHVVHNLGLKNITVEHCRVEDFLPQEPFHAVISRAFASLKNITDNGEHLLDKGGLVWAMKGHYPIEEIDGLSPRWQLEDAIALNVPELAADRHLIKISKAR